MESICGELSFASRSLVDDPLQDLATAFLDHSYCACANDVMEMTTNSTEKRYFTKMISLTKISRINPFSRRSFDLEEEAPDLPGATGSFQTFRGRCLFFEEFLAPSMVSCTVFSADRRSVRRFSMYYRPEMACRPSGFFLAG